MKDLQAFTCEIALLRCPPNRERPDKHYHQNGLFYMIYIYYAITNIFIFIYFSLSHSEVSMTSNTGIIPIVVDYNISQITPYVFVTAGDTAQQFPKVRSNGITCVINVADELPQIVFPSQSGIESLKYPIKDRPTFPVSKFFDVVADRIASNAASHRRTLLYCHHGRSRSVTFILAYLIKYHRLPLPTAFALVKERRQVALPNVGFWSQLKSYELHQQGILRNSLTYGQQLLDKISGGFQRVLALDPFVNIFSNTNRKLNFRLHYRHRPYHLSFPSKIFM